MLDIIEYPCGVYSNKAEERRERRHMLTVSKSVVLGTAFLAGVAIAARADPLCRTPTGPCRPPGSQIAALPSADAALAPDNVTLPEVNLFGPQLPGEYSYVCFSTKAEPHA
jgi:hypothetical protein